MRRSIGRRDFRKILAELAVDYGGVDEEFGAGLHALAFAVYVVALSAGAEDAHLGHEGVGADYQAAVGGEGAGGVLEVVELRHPELYLVQVEAADRFPLDLYEAAQVLLYAVADGGLCAGLGACDFDLHAGTHALGGAGGGPCRHGYRVGHQDGQQ